MTFKEICEQFFEEIENICNTFPNVTINGRKISHIDVLDLKLDTKAEDNQE